MSTEKTDNDDLTLGLRLKQIRKIRGYTQQQVADIFEISKDYVSRIEKQERKPAVHLKKAIVKWLKEGDISPEAKDLVEKIKKASENGNKIKASIEPGCGTKKQQLIENRQRPTVSEATLRIMIEWMDEYFRDNPGQSLFFYEDIRDRYDSFRQFVEKKSAQAGYKDRLPDKKSANGEG